MALIMLLAFLIKLYGFKWMDYTGFPEFYRDYYMTSGIMHGSLTLLGPGSMQHGYHFGPFYYYLFVPMFILFGGHPFSLIFTGIIISTLTAYALFKLLLLWSNSRPLARTGAVFLAVSVYSLHLASYVSNPNFLPLFVLWFFYHLTKILNFNETWQDWLYLGIAFGLASQLHATATLVLPIVTIIVLILQRRQVKIQAALIVTAACLATYLPYLFYEFTHRFQNLGRLFTLGATTLHGKNHFLSLRAIWNFIEGTLTPFNDWYFYAAMRPNILNIFVALFGLIFLGVLIYKLLKPQAQKGDAIKISAAGKRIIFTWTIVACIMLLLFNKAVHDHYLFILWPLPLIFLTYGAFWLKAKFGVFKPLVALFIVMSLLQVYSFYNVPHLTWPEFWKVYNSQYKDQPGVSEIGS